MLSSGQCWCKHNRERGYAKSKRSFLSREGGAWTLFKTWTWPAPRFVTRFCIRCSSFTKIYTFIYLINLPKYIQFAVQTGRIANCDDALSAPLTLYPLLFSTAVFEFNYTSTPNLSFLSVFSNFFCHIGRTDDITTEIWSPAPFSGTSPKPTSNPNRLHRHPTSKKWCHLHRPSSPAIENLVNANPVRLAKGLIQVRISRFLPPDAYFCLIKKFTPRDSAPHVPSSFEQELNRTIDMKPLPILLRMNLSYLPTLNA